MTEDAIPGEPMWRQASIEWASDIRPRKQVWLWENKIPLGTPSALAGRGGTGKTTYACHLIARLSRGQLPGKYHGEPRRSLIWSGEDAWATVLVPRLIANGADLNMVGRLSIASDIDGDTSEVTPRLPLDTPTISEAITSSGAVLVLFDPIASTMNGDLNREADVRAAVDALARVAEDTGAVTMFVRHFGKGGGNASDKMSGSHAFRDTVRSLFLFAEDGDRVIVTQDKGNYAPRGEESFAFRLENVAVPTEDGPADVARVADLGNSDVSVSDVINRAHGDAGDDLDEIDEWLTALLANSSENGVKATEVFSSADAAGFSKDQAKRSKKRLGILAERPSNPGPWFWSLPGKPKAGSTEPDQEQGAPHHALPALPALPVRSEGVEQGAEQGREQSAGERSLPPAGPPTPAAMPTKAPGSRPRPRRQHQRTIRGKSVDSYPACIVCTKPVVAGQGDTHFSCSKQPIEATA